jgi:hypothetical protein
VLGLIAGVSAWILTGAIGVALYLGREEGRATGGAAAAIIGLLVLVLMPATVAVAVGGLGNSAAALRTRGDSMILATLGFLLSGLHVGALVGLIFFTIWLH